MMGVFRKLMPREDKFFDMFSEHSRTVVEAAEALRDLLNGKDVEANCERIVTLEDRADNIPAKCCLLFGAASSHLLIAATSRT